MAGQIDSRVFGLGDNHFSTIAGGNVNATLRYSYKIARLFRGGISNNCRYYSGNIAIDKI